MQQIPLKYLPDSMTVRDVDESADYDGQYLEPYVIGHVRFEPAESLAPNQFRLADGAKGRIFIDAVNSIGARRIPVGSKVTIADYNDMCVLTCTACKGPRSIHHWEVDVG